MRLRVDPSPELLSLAAAQDGVLATVQAAQHGLGRYSVARLIDTQQWCRLERGVLYVRGQPPSYRSLAWAGFLLGGPGARIGGVGAGYLSGLLNEVPASVPVLVPHTRVVAERPPWIFRRERAGVRGMGTVGSPPRLRVEDTVLDLCHSADSERVVSLITTAVQHRLTTVGRLRRACASRAKMRHRRLVMDLLAEVEEGAETPLELAYLRRVERPHGLPRGVRQSRVGTAGLIRDVRYDEFGLILELDGRIGHEGLGRSVTCVGTTWPPSMVTRRCATGGATFSVAVAGGGAGRGRAEGPRVGRIAGSVSPLP